VSSLYQADAEEDLRSMGRGAKTAAQERMEGAFGVKKPTPGGGRASSRGGLERKRSRRW
jgi:hypothetical protein